MSRCFESYLIVEDFIIPAETPEQIKNAEEALAALGVPEAFIWVGLPPDTRRSPMKIYAHNADSLNPKEDV